MVARLAKADTGSLIFSARAKMPSIVMAMMIATPIAILLLVDLICATASRANMLRAFASPRETLLPLIKRGREMSPRDALVDRRERDLRWLAFVENATKMSLAQVAIEAGIAHSTLSRIRRPNTKHHLSERAYGPVTRRFNLPGPHEFERAITPRALETSAFREEAAPYGFPSEDRRANAVRALIAGRNDTHAWTISSDVIARAGVLPGDILVIEGGRAPQPGNVVCAQVYDRVGGVHAQTVMRVYRPGWLMPAANDPIAWQPIKVAEGEVVIMGVMTDLFRIAA